MGKKRKREKNATGADNREYIRAYLERKGKRDEEFQKQKAARGDRRLKLEEQRLDLLRQLIRQREQRSCGTNVHEN